ncbi:MAG: metallophosphoesterase [Polyangiaceae bacterium]|nr:metallophosphoesterase [Polyangiaceae bacterium]
MLSLLHTADWHLGRRFSSFDDGDRLKLSRARLEAVARAFDVGERFRVDAALCAGDLFDAPDPGEEHWRGLLGVLARTRREVPIFLLPGNHDPLTRGSVWWPDHPFRRGLPGWVHVVDRDDFEHALPHDAVLLARPCRSTAGDSDLALQLPAREPGDTRLRVGLVHGSTFDLPGYQTNFPLARDAAARRGLDYLAIGDTHAFRDVTPDQPAPTVYPGAPEPMTFDERGAGHVAVVSLLRHGLRAEVRKERVGYWRWLDLTCRDVEELRGVMSLPELERAVVRVKLEMQVTLAEHAEVERMLGELRGNDATHGRAGVLVVEREGLQLSRGAALTLEDLPPALAEAARRLSALADEATDDAARERAGRALVHLMRLWSELGTS